MKQKYKSVLGLNTVKAFIVVLLSVAIIAIVTLVVLQALNSTVASSSSIVTITNETNSTTAGAWINSTGYTLRSPTNGTYPSATNCVITTVYNVTGGGGAISAGNYYVNPATCVVTNATSSYYNNVTITYTFNYGIILTGTSSVVNNVSTGITSFFGNSSTFFALLGVVVIILIISLVVVVVNRFGGDSTGGTNQQPSL